MDRRRSTDRNAFPPPSSRLPCAAEANRVPSAARLSRGHLAPITRSRFFQAEDDGGLGLRGKRLQVGNRLLELLLAGFTQNVNLELSLSSTALVPKQMPDLVERKTRIAWLLSLCSRASRVV